MTQTAAPVTERPIDRMLVAFPNARPGGQHGWYSAKCAAHDDSNASLSFREADDGGVIIKCHAGCERRAVTDAVGLTWKDLSPKGNYRPTFVARPKLELVDLAADKLIPWQFLFNLGIEDEYLWHGSKVIKIPYYTASGEEHTKTRVRTELSGNKGSKWDEDTPGSMIPYGLNRLDIAQLQRYLLIGEGESDAWSCWFHNIPYLGIPGATNEKCLDGKVLAGIPRVYIIQEPDKAGQGFYKRVHQQLRATGYQGELFALPFKKLTGCKDPNALHKHLKGQGFREMIAEALKAAVPSGDELDRTRRPKLEYYQLQDLQNEVFPDLKWAIPDILPEGLTWLCGKPKLGKSWMLLSMMCSIALGGVALGNVPVERGEVLYLSLEDNKRRLKDRANKVLSNLKMSPNFYYRTDYPRLNNGGLAALEEFLQEHPNCRLIGIDTWAKIKPKSSGQGKQQYDEDYDALTPLQELAGKYNVSIVIVHHMRKLESEDPLDTVSGSVALQGAVDGFLLLYRKRGEEDARLFITGRDIEEEQELMITFNHDTATWRVKGNADEMAGTPERQAILNVLKPFPDGLPAREIATKLDKNLYTVRNLLVSLRNENKIFLKNNVYCLVRHSEGSYPSESSEHSEARSKPSLEIVQPHYDNAQNNGFRSEGIVRVVTPTNTLAEPIVTSENGTLTTLTRVTTQNHSEGSEAPHGETENPLTTLTTQTAEKHSEGRASHSNELTEATIVPENGTLTTLTTQNSSLRSEGSDPLIQSPDTEVQSDVWELTL